MAIAKQGFNMSGYHILKADFHVHFMGANIGDPWPTIERYRRENFDIVALTEHGHQTDTGVEHQAAGEARRRFGNKFFVLPGKECVVAGDPRGCFSGNHVAAIFLDGNVSDYDEGGNPRGMKEHLREIHGRGGIGILAHEASMQTSSDPKKRFWHHRKKFDLDGWEIGTFLSIRHRHAEEAIAEGYLTVASSDAHRDFQALSIANQCHTYVFARERSQSGVREALDRRQTVCYLNGFVIGQEQWVDKYREWKIKMHLAALREWSLQAVTGEMPPSASALFPLTKETDQLHVMIRLMQHYCSATLSREYYLGEHDKVALFLLTRSPETTIRSALQSMMDCLATNFFWQIEDAYFARQRQKLAEREIQVGRIKHPQASDWSRLGILSCDIGDCPKALYYFSRAMKMGCGTQKFFRAYTLAASNGSPAVALSICRKALQRHRGDRVIIGLQSNLERMIRRKPSSKRDCS